MIESAKEPALTFETTILPMLVPPVPWNAAKYGGYLLAESKYILCWMGGGGCTTELSMLAPPVTWNTAKYGGTYWQKVDLMLEWRGEERKGGKFGFRDGHITYICTTCLETQPNMGYLLAESMSGEGRGGLGGRGRGGKRRGEEDSLRERQGGKFCSWDGHK